MLQSTTTTRAGGGAAGRLHPDAPTSPTIADKCGEGDKRGFVIGLSRVAVRRCECCIPSPPLEPTAPAASSALRPLSLGSARAPRLDLDEPRSHSRSCHCHPHAHTHQKRKPVEFHSASLEPHTLASPPSSYKAHTRPSCEPRPTARSSSSNPHQAVPRT